MTYESLPRVVPFAGRYALHVLHKRYSRLHLLHQTKNPVVYRAH
jgi:hypothetical protein